MTQTDLNERLYEKCALCHLFVEPNSAFKDSTPEFPIAEYIHLHRGDEADEALDESHEPAPSGMRATLSVWQEFGPPEMKERFLRDINDPEALKDVLSALWLYTGWEYVTRQMTTPQRELWADVIDESHKDTDSAPVDRWWRR